MSDKKFPEGFYWGAATASYQVEGGIENCDWAEAAREGRVPPCGLACDHYNRFDADFAIAKELGHTAHRFSLEWARIESEEGVFNEEAIIHYRKVLQSLHRHGLKPYVTLWHWTLPDWLANTGGIERHDFPQIFARYCAYAVKNLYPDAEHFSTINEPYSMVINGWLQGEFPPFRRFSLLSFFKIKYDDIKKDQTIPDLFAPIKFFTVANQLAEAHNIAYREIKKVQPNAVVSIVFQIYFFKTSATWISRFLAQIQMWQRNHRFLKKVFKQCDALGINYYFSSDVGFKQTYPKTDMGWDSRPADIFGALMQVKRYNLPVFVAEAGCADAGDSFRADYITKTVLGIHSAIEHGVDVRGFMYWSLLDNYEWALGFAKRFGLVEVNYETQERTVRPSAYVYKKIIENNGIVE